MSAGIFYHLENHTTKDVSVAREVLLDHSQGLSLEEIRQVSGVPKSTVRRIIDRGYGTDLGLEQILDLSDEDFAKLVAARAAAA